MSKHGQPEIYEEPGREEVQDWSLKKKVRYAIHLLRKYEPEGDQEYYGAFSGGKDSCVIKYLAEKAGVKVTWRYNPCPDPPELIRFIREFHPDVIWNKPLSPFFQTVAKNGLPTHSMRFCCQISKEVFGKRKQKIIGVRAVESPRRAASWSSIQAGFVAPILFWSDEELWRFIKKTNMPYCSLYDEGFTRLGCVGCPLGGQKSRDATFKRWPKYERAWKNACKKLWENQNEQWKKSQARWGLYSWEDHWNAWRGDYRKHFASYKEKILQPVFEDEETDICQDLTRYQQ